MACIMQSFQLYIQKAESSLSKKCVLSLCPWPLCICFVLAYLPAPEENVAGEHSDWPASLTCPSRADSVFKEKAGGEEGLLGNYLQGKCILKTEHPKDIRPVTMRKVTHLLNVCQQEKYMQEYLYLQGVDPVQSSWVTFTIVAKRRELQVQHKVPNSSPRHAAALQKHSWRLTREQLSQKHILRIIIFCFNVIQSLRL